MRIAERSHFLPINPEKLYHIYHISNKHIFLLIWAYVNSEIGKCVTGSGGKRWKKEGKMGEKMRGGRRAEGWG